MAHLLILFLALFFLFPIVIVVVIALLAARRRRLPAVAQRLGFSFDPALRQIAISPTQELPFIKIVGDANVGWISNMMRGRTSVGDMLCCDYMADGSRNQRQTLFCLNVRGKHVPSFALFPRQSAIGKRIDRGFAAATKAGAAAMGHNRVSDAIAKAADEHVAFDSDAGVAFPEHPEFTSRFEVHASDADAVRQLLGPAVLDDFVRHRRQQPHLHVANDWLVLYQLWRVAPVSKYAAELEHAQQVFRDMDVSSLASTYGVVTAADRG